MNPEPSAAGFVVPGPIRPEIRAFLVNYVRTDVRWAEWIGWNLERHGFRVVLDAWDLPPRSNIIRYMNDSVAGSRYTMALLSPEYLASSHSTYWQGALLDDPKGAKRRLVPIRIARCRPRGLLRGIQSLDLFDREEDEARRWLIRTASWVLDGGRILPDHEPAFPGAQPGSPGAQARVPAQEPPTGQRPPSKAVELARRVPATLAQAIATPVDPRPPVGPAEQAVRGRSEPIYPVPPAPVRSRRAARWTAVPSAILGLPALGAGAGVQAAGAAGGTVTGPIAAAAAGAALGIVVCGSIGAAALAATALAAVVGALGGTVGAGFAGSGSVATVTIEVSAAVVMAVIYGLIMRPPAAPGPSEVKPTRRAAGVRAGRPSVLPSAVAPKPGVGHTTIFISYSHRDRDWLDRILVHLGPLVRTGEIHVWSDRRLRSGDKWRAEISRSLEEANVAILLVTPDFLNSRFISSYELPPLLRAADSGDFRIIPVIVKYSLFAETTLAEFQSHNDPDRSLATMEREDGPDEVERCLARLAVDVWPTPHEPIRV